MKKHLIGFCRNPKLFFKNQFQNALFYVKIVLIATVRSEDMTKVVKFGGSSLANASQFSKAGKIIRSEESRRYVVPSAPGKRNAKDTKVTDMFYRCYEMAEAEEDFMPLLKKIQ